MRFSLLSSPPSCTHYISNVRIESGLNYFWEFPLCNNLFAKIYFSFLLMKNRVILERIESVRNIYFWTAQFWKEYFSEILYQCDFGKNEVWRTFSDSLLSHLLSKNTWTSAILERVESYKKIWKAYNCIYLIQTPSRQILTRTILERINSEFNSNVWKS